MKLTLKALKMARHWRVTLVSVTCALFVANSLAGSRDGQEHTMPGGPGKAETQKVCSGCHELEKSFSMRHDRAGWHRTIEKMITLGAKATEHEFNAVLDYLTRHFPADEVPLIKVNKATAIELESGLSLKRSHASAIIRYRDKFGRFKSIDELKKVPGIDISRIEARKDRLSFED